MDKRKITVARLWPKYDGRYESRAGVISALDPARYRTVCTYLAKSSEKHNSFEENGYKTFYLSNKKALRYFNPLVAWKLAKILKAEKVDIIHCHKHKATVYGAIAAVLAQTPVAIAHVHGLGRTRNWRRKLVNSFIMKRVDKILTVGATVRADFLSSNRSVPPEKVCSVGNSIDCERFAETTLSKHQAKERLSLSPEAIVFGTVGRLTPAKGQDYLITAFTKVKRQVPSALLVIVGDGRYRAQLEKQAVETSLGQSIHFLGQRSDIPRVLRAMDVFVLPSVGEEGLPKALLEAMASGIPCIGTNFSGIPDILGGSEFGQLVPPRDSNALAEVMIRIAQLPGAERIEIGQKASQRVRDEYSHEVLCQRLERIYEGLAVDKGRLSEYYIISYPKSGRTWLRLMIAKLLHAHFKLRVRRKHFLELKHYRQYNNSVPSVRVTHDPDGHTTWSCQLNELQQMIELRYRNSKVIFLVRDPRDVVVSHYFQNSRRPKNSPEQVFRGDISEYIRDPRLGIDSIVKFCNLWASQRDVPKDFLLVRYEDLHRDTVGQLKRVADFLRIGNVNEQQLKEAVDFASFENMQRMERKDYFRSGMLRPANAGDPESYKTRKGKVHGFRDYMGKGDIEYLNKKLCRDFDSFFGYKFE